MQSIKDPIEQTAMVTAPYCKTLSNHLSLTLTFLNPSMVEGFRKFRVKATKLNFTITAKETSSNYIDTHTNRDVSNKINTTHF